MFLRYHRHDEAIAQFWRATALDPELAPAYSHWGRALSALGNHEQALARFQKAATLVPSSENHLNVGVSLYRLNRARRHGRSTEEEVREILRNAVRDEGGARAPLGSRIAARFAGKGLTEEIPELRGQEPRPADLES